MDRNFEPEELTKFNNLASEWWDLQGKCKPLHDLNIPRLQFITDRCELRQKKVLDIGCGGGILSESMAARGAIVTGIDIAPDLLEIARLHARQHQLTQITYSQTTAEEYAEIYPHSFDVITCMELLEHVPDPISIITAAAKLLKPNGHLFLATLNRTPKAYAFAILIAEYLLNILPRGTHQYEKFIRPSELDQWLRQARLQMKELTGLSYNPLTHKAMLSPELSINYLAYVTYKD